MLIVFFLSIIHFSRNKINSFRFGKQCLKNRTIQDKSTKYTKIQDNFLIFPKFRKYRTCGSPANGFQSLIINTKRSILDFASVLDPPLNTIDISQYCPFLYNMYNWMFWLCRKIKFANGDERILDGLERSFYEKNLKIALFCNTFIWKLKVFYSPTLKSDLVDFTTCGIELAQGNNERIYWKARPYKAWLNFPYILYSFLKIKLRTRFPWQKSLIYWEIYFPTTQYLHYSII